LRRGRYADEVMPIFAAERANLIAQGLAPLSG
jgi:hypothetical protein